MCVLSENEYQVHRGNITCAGGDVKYTGKNIKRGILLSEEEYKSGEEWRREEEGTTLTP